MECYGELWSAVDCYGVLWSATTEAQSTERDPSASRVFQRILWPKSIAKSSLPFLLLLLFLLTVAHLGHVTVPFIVEVRAIVQARASVLRVLFLPPFRARPRRRSQAATHVGGAHAEASADVIALVVLCAR